MSMAMGRGARKCKCGGQAEFWKRNRKWRCRECALKEGYAARCNGEAHNPQVAGMIDHCGVCMPRWGVMEVRPSDWPLKGGIK